MPERHIRIEHLSLRLRGVPAETGRAVADRTGEAVARAVSQGPAGGGAIASLDLGTVPAPAGGDAGTIAASIGRALAARLGEKGS